MLSLCFISLFYYSVVTAPVLWLLFQFQSINSKKRVRLRFHGSDLFLRIFKSYLRELQRMNDKTEAFKTVAKFRVSIFIQSLLHSPSLSERKVLEGSLNERKFFFQS